jgi:DNA-binding NarL/FixJ family response regulator
MPLDPAAKDVVVFSRFLYRCESLAQAIRECAGCRATAVTQPDLMLLAGFETILIDLDTSLEAALEVVHAITARRPESKVVLVGMEESEENVIKLAEAGASGYSTPATSLDDLIGIVRSVQNGEFNCPAHITYALYTHLARLAGADHLMQRSWVLTTREQRVLDLLSQSLSNKEIAASLCISEYTAKNHVHRILKKLGWKSRSFAVSSGMRRPPASVFWPISARLRS